MAAKAGETARETGDFRCTKCREKTHVTRGRKIPKCKNCGGTTFDTRENEPRNKSTSKKKRGSKTKSTSKSSKKK